MRHAGYISKFAVAAHWDVTGAKPALNRVRSTLVCGPARTLKVRRMGSGLEFLSSKDPGPKEIQNPKNERGFCFVFNVFSTGTPTEADIPMAGCFSSFPTFGLPSDLGISNFVILLFGESCQRIFYILNMFPGQRRTGLQND